MRHGVGTGRAAPGHALAAGTAHCPDLRHPCRWEGFQPVPHRRRPDRGTARDGNCVSVPFDYQHNCLLYLPLTRSAGRGGLLRPAGRADPAAGGGIPRPRPGAVHFLPRHVGGQGTAAGRGAAFPVFTMGRRPARTLAAFRAAPGSILLATGAAWEGLDFAGDGVSLLIIPRLPFAYPDAVKEKRAGGLPEPAGVPALRRCPGNADQTAAGLWPGHPHRNRHLCRRRAGSRAARGRRYFQSMAEALPEMPVTGSLRAVEQFYRDHKGRRLFPSPQRRMKLLHLLRLFAIPWWCW